MWGQFCPTLSIFHAKYGVGTSRLKLQLTGREIIRYRRFWFIRASPMRVSCFKCNPYHSPANSIGCLSMLATWEGNTWGNTCLFPQVFTFFCLFLIYSLLLSYTILFCWLKKVLYSVMSL